MFSSDVMFKWVLSLGKTPEHTSVLPQVKKSQKILEGQGKAQEFYLQLRKIDILKKSEGKIEFITDTTDLILLMIEETFLNQLNYVISVTCFVLEVDQALGHYFF